jgi:autoinducer 2-degrading protein
MYVVIVDFVAKPGHVDAFRAAMIGNARTSLASEPGCRQFDVSVAPDDPAKIFLYELYDDLAAFEAHLQTAHYRDFDAKTAPWVAAKSARKLQRICPD